MPTTASHLNQINVVIIPVIDQDAQIAFYESIGFEKRTDIAFGGGQYRWVEVYPPSGTAGIALAPPPPGGSAGGVQTGIALATDDVDASHAHLKGLGVDVDAEVSRMGEPVPPMFWLRDPEANTLLVVQSAPNA